MTSWREGPTQGQCFLTEGIVPTSATFDILTALSSPAEQLSLEKQVPSDGGLTCGLIVSAPWWSFENCKTS